MNPPDGLVQLNPAENVEARMALASLLGSTLAELKNIDSNVVGGSQNIRALKTDINKVIPPFNPTASHVQNHVQPAITVTIPQYQPQPVPPPVAQPQTPAIQEDPNQLLFDFNQKITPETINNKLDLIVEKLNRVIEILK